MSWSTLQRIVTGRVQRFHGCGKSLSAGKSKIEYDRSSCNGHGAGKERPMGPNSICLRKVFLYDRFVPQSR